MQHATQPKAHAMRRTRPARPPPPPTYRNDPTGGAGATPRRTAPRRGGAGGDRRPTRRAAPTPKTPTPRTPRAAPVPPLATLRYGAARATGGLPEGPPQPRKTPRAAPAPPLVTLRHNNGATRAPGGLPEGPPLLSKSDPAPPEIGRGSKRALTHPPESLTASCEAAGEPPGLQGPTRPPQGRFQAGPDTWVGQLRVDPRRYKAPPY